jgi:dipeptidyl aminopeptidase/acylaminoacyl peptidase
MDEIPLGRAVRVVVALALCACIVGCAAERATPPSPTPTPAPAEAWIDHEVVSQGGGVVVERVSYQSDAHKVWAELCRPDDSQRHALILWNHGGFAGLGSGDRDGCRGFAQSGFVMAMSEYRGEGGSEGRVEVCDGEVHDVQVLLGLLRQEAFVDATHTAAVGGSHGGCITLELALREPTLKAAVDYFGPADWATLYEWWTGQGQSTNSGLAAVVLQAIGGTPAQVPDEYARRSPARRLAGLTVPLLIAHGTADDVVPFEQSCLKREVLDAAGRHVDAWDLDHTFRPQPDASTCGGGLRGDDLAAVATARNALLIYEGEGHGFGGAAQRHLTVVTLSFLLGHL